MVLFVLLLGCNNEEPLPTNPAENGNDNQFVSHITIDEVLSYIPDELKNKTLVVFKDESGNEKKLETSFIEDVKQRTEHGASYTREIFTIRYFSADEPYFRMELTGQGLYSSKLEIKKDLNAMLMPMNPSGSSSVTIEFENGQPVVSMFSTFKENIELNGKAFKNVFFSNSSLTPYDSYSEISVNSTEGVVTFRDETNTLWVFDRFEQ